MVNFDKIAYRKNKYDENFQIVILASYGIKKPPKI